MIFYYYHSALVFWGLSIALNVFKLLVARAHIKWYPLCFLGPLVYFTIGILAIYRLLIFIILIIRHRFKFGGFLSGLDAIHMANESANRINFLFIVKSPHVLPDGFLYRNMRHVVRDMQKLTKFNSIFCKFLGYSYMVKDELGVDECIRRMKLLQTSNSQLTKRQLLRLCNEYFNAELPEGNTVPWEIIVGTQRVYKYVWTSNVNGCEFYYPILFRSQMALADSVTILQIMNKMLTGRERTSEEEHHGSGMNSSEKESLEALSKRIGCFDKIVARVFVAIAFPAFFVMDYFAKRKERNYWEKQNLTGYENYAFDMDHRNEISNQIGKIYHKNRDFPLLSTLLAVISSFMGNFILPLTDHEYLIYYLHSSLSIYTSAFGIICPYVEKMENVKIKNKAISVGIELPIYIERRRNELSFRNRVLRVSQKSKVSQYFMDCEMVRFLHDVVGTYFPQFILRYLSKRLKSSLLINLIPGPKTQICATMGDMLSLPVCDIIAFTPNKNGSGIAFTVVDYNGRFQLGLTADKSIIQEEAQLFEWISNDLTNHVNRIYARLNGI